MSAWHPAATLLRRLSLDGCASADWSGGLATHIDGCTACQAALERWESQGQPAATPAERPAIPGYAILAEIGRGGIGVVYRAWHDLLAREVALKLIPGGLHDDRSRPSDGLREARAGARVKHPNVVPVHEVGTAGGWVYVVMDLIEGGTLADRLRGGPIAPAAAARVVESVARTMGEVHRRGVLHLDLKPANILLDGPPDAPAQACTPLVADFGLARRIDAAEGTVGPAGQGTPSYMAPEQAGESKPGDRPTPAADVYALGATLYHALTGRPPFAGASAIDTMIQVRTQDPVAPRALVAGIPRDLETICLKCLRKEPGSRYASAEELADDLRRWQGGLPIKARPASPAEKTWRLCRRHPAVSSLVATLAVGLIVGVATLVVLLHTVDDEHRRTTEALRSTEAFEAFTARAAHEMVGLLLATSRHPAAPSKEQYVASIIGLSESAHRPGNPPAVRTALGELEQHLGWELMMAGRKDEAMRLFDAAVDDLSASLRADLSDHPVQVSLALSLYHAALMRCQLDRVAESVDLFERSAELILHGKPDNNFHNLVTIYKLMCGHFSGELDSAAGRKAARLRERIKGGLEGSLREAPGNSPSRSCLEEIRWYDLLDSIGTPPTVTRADDDPVSWAAGLVSAVRGVFPAIGAGEVSSPADCFRLLSATAGHTATRQRNQGRIDDARRTAERLMAVARMLVAEYPDQATAHFLPGEAYCQVAKNGWATGDHSVIRPAYVQGLEAARRAAELDPNDAAIGRLVATLTKKVAEQAGVETQGQAAAR